MTGQVPLGGRFDAPAPQQNQPVATIGQFFGVLRRHLLAVLVCLVLGVLLAGLLLSSTPKSYEATAVVDVSPIFGTSSSTDAASSGTAVSTITESRIATSTSVALIAQRALRFQGTPEDLSEHVVVTSPLDSRVLNMTFSSSTATGAADGANAFARAYLDYRTRTVQDALKARVALISTQVADFQKALRALDRPAPRRDAAQVTAQRTSIQNQIQQLQNQLNTYQTSVIKPGEVAGAASAPSAPSAPRPALYVAGGVLLGLLLGLLVAFVRDRRDDVVHDADTAEERLGAPVLAQSVAVRDPRGLTALVDPAGAEADAYRTVATTVASEPSSRQVVLLCSASTVTDHPAAMNLAVTFATQGLRTVLAGTHASIDAAAGLLSAGPAARGAGSPLSEQVRASGTVPRLSLLSLGDEISLAATLRANGDDLAGVLPQADVVVLDGINIAFPSTLLRLGHLSREAVVLVQRNQSTSTELERVASHLAQVRTTVLGSILLTSVKGRRRRSAPTAPQKPRPEADRPESERSESDRSEAEPRDQSGAYSSASATTRRS